MISSSILTFSEKPLTYGNLLVFSLNLTSRVRFEIKGGDSLTARAAYKNWQGTPKSLIEILTSWYTGRVSKDTQDTYAKLKGASLLDVASTWPVPILLAVWVRRYLDTGIPKLRGHHRPYWPATRENELDHSLLPASKLFIYGERSERWSRKGRKNWLSSFFESLLTFVMKQRRKWLLNEDKFSFVINSFISMNMNK